MRRLLVLGLLGLAMLGLARAAWAHAGFVSSDPVNGAVLADPPADVTVTFTEPLDPGLSTLTLTDAGGGEVATGDPSVDGVTMTVPVVDAIAEGVYTANWRVVSTEDGHVTAGAFSFGVGDVAAPTDGGSEVATVGPTPLSIASKASLYCGLMLLVAIAVVGLGAFGGRPEALRPLGVAAGALAFAGSVGILAAEQQAVGAPMADLVGSATGRPFVLLVGVSLAAAGCAVLAAARPAWRRLFWVAGAVAAVAMFVRTTTGHPAAATLPLLQETVQWIHFVAAGTWIGGLVLLATLLRETPAPPPGPVRRFSSLAVVAVGVVVLTGIVRSLSQLGGPGDALDALGGAYGRALAVKVALAVVLIVLGARNRRRSIPRLSDGDPTALRRLVRAEVVVALGVVLATATLTGLSPLAATPSVPAVPDRDTVTGSDFATTTRVELTVTPGAPGPNVFRARVLDYDSDEPLSPDAVTLRLRSVTRPELAPVSVALAPDGDAWVGQGTDLSTAGTWRVDANVVTGADTVEVPLTVVTASRGTVPPPGGSFGTTTFPEGVSMSLHLDPATAGENVLHVDLVAPDGSPLAPGEVVVVATSQDGAPVRFAPQTGEGRATLAVPIALETGTWTIDAVALTPDGRAFQADLFGVPIA